MDHNPLQGKAGTTAIMWKKPSSATAERRKQHKSSFFFDAPQMVVIPSWLWA
jgi:hypothetical protein